MAQETSGSTPLFGVFALSIYSIFLIPYTLTKLFGGDGEEAEVVKTWSSKKDGRKQGLLDKARDKLRQVFTARLLLMWAAYALLFWYVSVASKPIERFDPFEILQLSQNATDSDVKKAYRKLSLQYHPDKNPDPVATEYFTNHIIKAYKALTDEVSRENYKKYGHPDGPQAMSISVALPEWFFSKDKNAAPLILLSLLLGGIVLPLGLAACYLGRSAQYTGPNEVMHETVTWYWHSQYAVKPNQGVGRIPETLVVAKEFIVLPATGGQGPALDDLRRALSATYPELKDRAGPFFKKRRMELVKAHLLLMAHLARQPVPAPLQRDLSAVLQKAPALLQEMLGVAAAPVRIRPGYGWATPTVAVVEMMQCLVQAVTVEEKKRQPQLAKSPDSLAALLQLPHMDSDVAKALAKKKVKTLPELAALPKEERRAALQGCGLSGAEAEDVETFLSALPTAYVTARLLVEGPDGVEVEGGIRGGDGGDVVTCRARVMLWRPSHMAAGFDPDTIKGTAARAYTPNFPFPRDEHWYFLVVDPATNALLGINRAALLQAEAVGARYASNWVHKTTSAAVSKLLTPGKAAAAGGGKAANGGGGGSGAEGEAGGGGGDAQYDSLEALLEDQGQTVEVTFLAPPPGKHELFLYVMPDSWLGADRVLPFKLRTVEASRADREGRSARAAAAGGKLQRSEESEAALGGAAEREDGGEGEVNGRGSGGGSDEEGREEEGSEEGEPEYDSDEYGTEESGEEESGGEEGEE